MGPGGAESSQVLVKSLVKVAFRGELLFRPLRPDSIETIGVAVADAVRDGGQYAALRPSADEAGRSIAVKGLNVRQRATDHAAIAALRDLFNQGVLTARLGEVVPARDAARAHELLEAGGLRSRIALDLTAF